MQPWAISNLQLRADRDAMDKIKRREAEAVSVATSVDDDCGCTAGHTCSRNAACPRLAREEKAR